MMELNPNVRRLTEGLERLRKQVRPTNGEMIAVLSIFLANLLSECTNARLVEHVIHVTLQGAKDKDLVQDLIKLCGAGK